MVIDSSLIEPNYNIPKFRIFHKSGILLLECTNIKLLFISVYMTCDSHVI